MLDERDASRLWKQLFRGQSISSLTLSEAELLLNDMHPESTADANLGQAR